MFPIVFILFCDRDWDGRVLKLMKNDHFLVFLAVWCSFPTFWVGYGVAYVSTAKINKSVTCSCVPSFFFFVCLFYFVLRAKLAGRSVQSLEKWSVFSLFNRLGPFPQVFRQVKECLTLELHKPIRVSPLPAFPIAFILF